ncbi:MAG: hypothetical protein WCV90_09065 [Candidatus Woesearchaeota archaeon]|jgi:hypothetical protein
MVQPPPKSQEQLVEQKITQQVTIAAGVTTVTSITIPANGKGYLKGYGYTWYTSNTYQLRAGNFVLPSRTDQEGSTSIPVIYGNPFPVNSGETISLSITNGDSAEHTYDIVFYVITNRIIQTNSTGGELILTTGGGGGSVSGSVIIYNSTLTTAANVTAKGLQVENNAPATLLDGTKSVTSATASALASTVTIKKGVLVSADDANTDVVYVGNATSQSIKLYAGDAEFIEIDDPAKIYVKKNVTNVTVNYHAS